MNTDNPISPELQSKIDAMPDENLRANILDVLNSPGNQTITNEQIFENMLARYERVSAERAKWRKWSDDEVLAFIQNFKQEMPNDYSDFLRQEQQKNEIDADTWWRAERLAERLYGELSGVDRSSLLGKVRDYMQTQLRAREEDR